MMGLLVDLILIIRKERIKYEVIGKKLFFYFREGIFEGLLYNIYGCTVSSNNENLL